MPPVTDSPSVRWPRTIVEMTEVVAAAFARAGRSAHQAEEDAETAVRALSEYFGGRMFYLPMAKGESIAARDDRIWREFDGKNVKDLARKYGLSEQGVYRVLAKMRTRRRRNAEVCK